MNVEGNYAIISDSDFCDANLVSNETNSITLPIKLRGLGQLDALYYEEPQTSLVGKGTLSTKLILGNAYNNKIRNGFEKPLPEVMLQADSLHDYSCDAETASPEHTDFWGMAIRMVKKKMHIIIYVVIFSLIAWVFYAKYTPISTSNADVTATLQELNTNYSLSQIKLDNSIAFGNYEAENSASLTQIRSQLSAEISRSIFIEEILSTAVSTLAHNLNTEISSESSARYLSDQIESSTRLNSNNVLSAAIVTESTTRLATDSSINIGVSSEKERSSFAESQIFSAFSAETSKRNAQDTEHKNMIEQLGISLSSETSTRYLSDQGESSSRYISDQMESSARLTSYNVLSAAVAT